MTSRRLLLVGAGGLAREVLAAVRSGAGDFDPLGALDDDAARHGSTIDGLPVLGGLDRIDDYPDAAVVLCVANVRRPAGRSALARRLGLADDRCASIVHPAASIAPGTSIGPGSVLLAGVVVTAPQRIGRHVLAMPHVLVTHDDRIDDGATIAGRAALGGGVHLGRDSYIGQGVTIREGVAIGPRAVVGMGSVVLGDVPADEVWAGVPARRLGARVVCSA